MVSILHSDEGGQRFSGTQIYLKILWFRGKVREGALNSGRPNLSAPKHTSLGSGWLRQRRELRNFSM